MQYVFEKGQDGLSVRKKMLIVIILSFTKQLLVVSENIKRIWI